MRNFADILVNGPGPSHLEYTDSHTSTNSAPPQSLSGLPPVYPQRPLPQHQNPQRNLHPTNFSVSGKQPEKLHFTNFSVLEKQLEKVALLMRDATIGAATTTEAMSGIWQKTQQMEELSARASEQCQLSRENPELEDLGLGAKFRKCAADLTEINDERFRNRLACSEQLAEIKAKNKQLKKQANQMNANLVGNVNELREVIEYYLKYLKLAGRMLGNPGFEQQVLNVQWSYQKIPKTSDPSDQLALLQKDFGVLRYYMRTQIEDMRVEQKRVLELMSSPENRYISKAEMEEQLGWTAQNFQKIDARARRGEIGKGGVNRPGQQGEPVLPVALQKAEQKDPVGSKLGGMLHWLLGYRDKQVKIIEELARKKLVDNLNNSPLFFIKETEYPAKKGYPPSFDPQTGEPTLRRQPPTDKQEANKWTLQSATSKAERDNVETTLKIAQWNKELKRVYLAGKFTNGAHASTTGRTSTMVNIPEIGTQEECNQYQECVEAQMTYMRKQLDRVYTRTGELKLFELEDNMRKGNGGRRMEKEAEKQLFEEERDAKLKEQKEENEKRRRLLMEGKNPGGLKADAEGGGDSKSNAEGGGDSEAGGSKSADPKSAETNNEENPQTKKEEAELPREEKIRQRIEHNIQERMNQLRKGMMQRPPVDQEAFADEQIKKLEELNRLHTLDTNRERSIMLEVLDEKMLGWLQEGENEAHHVEAHSTAEVETAVGNAKDCAKGAFLGKEYANVDAPPLRFEHEPSFDKKTIKNIVNDLNEDIDENAENRANENGDATEEDVNAEGNDVNGEEHQSVKGMNGEKDKNEKGVNENEAATQQEVIPEDQVPIQKASYYKDKFESEVKAFERRQRRQVQRSARNNTAGVDDAAALVEGKLKFLIDFDDELRREFARKGRGVEIYNTGCRLNKFSFGLLGCVDGSLEKVSHDEKDVNARLDAMISELPKVDGWDLSNAENKLQERGGAKAGKDKNVDSAGAVAAGNEKTATAVTAGAAAASGNSAILKTRLLQGVIDVYYSRLKVGLETKIADVGAPKTEAGKLPKAYEDIVNNFFGKPEGDGQKTLRTEHAETESEHKSGKMSDEARDNAQQWEKYEKKVQSTRKRTKFKEKLQELLSPPGKNESSSSSSSSADSNKASADLPDIYRTILQDRHAALEESIAHFKQRLSSWKSPRGWQSQEEKTRYLENQQKIVEALSERYAELGLTISGVKGVSLKNSRSFLSQIKQVRERIRVDFESELQALGARYTKMRGKEEEMQREADRRQAELMLKLEAEKARKWEHQMMLENETKGLDLEIKNEKNKVLDLYRWMVKNGHLEKLAGKQLLVNLEVGLRQIGGAGRGGSSSAEANSAEESRFADFSVVEENAGESSGGVSDENSIVSRGSFAEEMSEIGESLSKDMGTAKSVGEILPMRLSGRSKAAVSSFLGEAKVPAPSLTLHGFLPDASQLERAVEGLETGKHFQDDGLNVVKHARVNLSDSNDHANEHPTSSLGFIDNAIKTVKTLFANDDVPKEQSMVDDRPEVVQLKKAKRAQVSRLKLEEARQFEYLRTEAKLSGKEIKQIRRKIMVERMQSMGMSGNEIVKLMQPEEKDEVEEAVGEKQLPPEKKDNAVVELAGKVKDKIVDFFPKAEPDQNSVPKEETIQKFSPKERPDPLDLVGAASKGPAAVREARRARAKMSSQSEIQSAAEVVQQSSEQGPTKDSADQADAN